MELKHSLHPHAFKVLNYCRSIINLNANDEEYQKGKPYDSDEDYLSHLEAIFLVRLQLLDTQEELPLRVTKLELDLEKSKLEVAEKTLRSLQDALEELESFMRCRLGLSPKGPKGDPDKKTSLESKNGRYLPRLVRLMTLLALDEREQNAFIYIILHNIGTNFPSRSQRYDGRGMLRNMAMLTNMTSKQTLTFLGPERTHIKESLFELEDTLLSDFAGVTFKMSKEVLTALLGGQLSADQFLAIEQTALATVLTEEGMSPLQPVSQKNKVEIMDEEKNKENDDDQLLAQLEQSIKQQEVEPNKKRKKNRYMMEEKKSNELIPFLKMMIM